MVHEKNLSKLHNSEDRHFKNLETENTKKQKKLIENNDKMLKTYITLYWNKRKAESQRKEHYKKKRDKYMEKFGRLENIQNEKEQKRKVLIKRLEWKRDRIGWKKSMMQILEF